MTKLTKKELIHFSNLIQVTEDEKIYTGNPSDVEKMNQSLKPKIKKMIDEIKD